jgi:hypothetical protein
MKKYTKGIIAALTAALVALGAAYTGNDHIDATEWVNVAIAAIGAFQVWWAANVAGAPYVKAGIAAASAGLIALQSYIVGGVTISDWVQIGIAVVGALGVVAFKNVNESGQNLSYTGSVG